MTTAFTDPVSLLDLIGPLRRCTCGLPPAVSLDDGVWIECPKGEDGCGDIFWASTPERAAKLWNEE